MENVTGGPAIRVGGFFTLVGFILFFFGSIYEGYSVGGVGE